MIGEPSFEHGPETPKPATREEHSAQPTEQSEQQFLVTLDSQTKGLSQRIDTMKKWIGAGHSVAGEGEQVQVLEGYLDELQGFRYRVVAEPDNESLRTEAQKRLSEIQESLQRQGEVGMAIDNAAMAKQEQIDLNRIRQQQLEGEAEESMER